MVFVCVYRDKGASAAHALFFMSSGRADHPPPEGVARLRNRGPMGRPLSLVFLMPRLSAVIFATRALCVPSKECTKPKKMPM